MRQQQRDDTVLMRNIGPLLGKIKSAAGLSCFALFLWPIITGYFKRQGAKLTAPKYLQGSRFATVREVKKSVGRAGGGSIPIGTDVKMAKNIETQHLIGFGRSGSGKTTIMLQIIEAQRKRDAKAVILDSIKGDYVSRFYDPSRDLIFNPLDERHVGWSIMRELRTYMDVDAIAQSLIPQSHNEDAFWHNAARAVFSGCLHNLNLAGEKRNKAIWDFLAARRSTGYGIPQTNEAAGLEIHRGRQFKTSGFGFCNASAVCSPLRVHAAERR